MSNTTSARRPRATSMMDVAAHAGVSQKTVSRVVNNEPHVTDEIRAKVTAAIAELGFRPNAAARSLKGARSRRIGMMTLGTALYGPASMVAGVEHEAQARGFALTVVRAEGTEKPELQTALDSLISQDVEAIVVSEPIDHHFPELDIPAELTILTLGTLEMPDRQNSLAVGLDEVGAALAATEHLLALGHTDVRHIAGPSTWTSSARRTTGWRNALLDADIEPQPVVEGDWSPRAGYDAMDELLARAGRGRLPDVTAVFVANDQMAIGAMAAAQHHGLRVPDDISIVGFDDHPVAEFLTIPLTTMRQDFDEATRLAMHRLIRTLDGHAPIERERMVPAQLVVRATTAPPPPSRPPLHALD
ncbi:LacI family DNA-binding transcriptional regulator [Curtobacterium sp. Leaf261]|uniref:LacI family DNA-binding transcriptional regulator n=1 Tax=Curtobacterium sp. Leaf261 TaxID=1736311 RepID=UPI000AC61B60|nr:LacI family DNA-binding transcriptional regulator [Curtobacterium sp. Leaf261]